MNFEYADSYERVPDDFYVEPAWVTEVLLDVEHFVGSIYDPAAGVGTIVDVARDRGFDAFGSDLHDRQAPAHLELRSPTDFLNGEGWPSVDNIVSNPPFVNALEFTRAAMVVARFKVAMFLPLRFLSSQGRADFFKERPPSRVLVIAERVTIAPNGIPAVGKNGKPTSGKTDHAWFIWAHDRQGPPTLGWVRKPLGV